MSLLARACHTECLVDVKECHKKYQKKKKRHLKNPYTIEYLLYVYVEIIIDKSFGLDVKFFLVTLSQFREKKVPAELAHTITTNSTTTR